MIEHNIHPKTLMLQSLLPVGNQRPKYLECKCLSPGVAPGLLLSNWSWSRNFHLKYVNLEKYKPLKILAVQLSGSR